MIPDWQLLLSAIAITLGYVVSESIEDDRMADFVYWFLLSVGVFLILYLLVIN